MAWPDALELPRESLAVTPTPLQPYPALGRELGLTLYVKHEDRSDHLASGNKIRKLEYVLGDARRQGADTLITAGNSHSNQCKAVAYLARRLGLACRLVFCEDPPPDDANGNYLIDLLCGAAIHWRPPAAWAAIDDELAAVAATVRAAGRRPYIIPPGASNWLGTLGYVRMAGELAAQEAALNAQIDVIVLPTASGGTHAGLLIGGHLHNRPWTIIGVCVLGDRAYFAARHATILAELQAHAGYTPTPSTERVALFDGALGDGYACYSDADIARLVHLAQHHGLLLDPTYTLKAFTGLEMLLAQGRIQRGATVVLVHTGGLFSLFNADAALRRRLRQPLARQAAMAATAAAVASTRPDG